jgi:hypothetical protein
MNEIIVRQHPTSKGRDEIFSHLEQINNSQLKLWTDDGIDRVKLLTTDVYNNKASIKRQIDYLDNIPETPKRRKKVYYSFRLSTSRFKLFKPSGKYYPVIHLAGNYLSDSDFKIGDVIEVSLRPGRIVITKALLPEENIKT